ncbi:hypothetical protein [Marinobacterium sediminicola]|uniref:Flagellar hook-length control protein FliK n=1 Tax=Marinobacterium sediminicola TaxID=518898 RepID=A0ABY1RYK8_9GAMM|nr:hypothetical protein [Marinobacterium sediminicola]ULG68768.1 hypothetical protein LN244_13875 [Marinobacterium sediminicola]SMR73297.1 hypothetical protein SAMN04487964_103240 [Marinobacterium sediminicola]
MAIIKTGSNAALPLNLVALPSAPLSASPAAAMPEGASSTPGFHLLFQGSLQAQGGRALQVENGKSLPPGGELLPDDSTDTEATLTAATSSEEGAAEGLLKTSAGDESALVDERLALALPAQSEIKAASAPSSVHAESMDKTAPEALAAAAEQPRQASLTEASARAQLVAEQGHAGRATPDAVISADHAEPSTELSDHARMSAQAAERAMPSPALPADAAVAASASTQTVSATSADALAATAPTGVTATARGQADTLAAATTPAKPAVVTDAPAKPEAATILEATKVQPGEPSMAERPANAKDAGRVTPSSAMPAAMTVNGAAQDIGQQTITTGPLDVAAIGQPAVDGPAAEKASQVVQSAGVMVADGTETDRTTPAPSAALAAGVADSVDVDKEALVQPAGTVTAMTDTSGVTSASRSAGVSPEVVDLAGKDVPASSLGARPDGARSTLDMPPPACGLCCPECSTAGASR